MSVVSIIVPLYNKASYVARAIDSIFSQTFQDFEIIVVDDGSTDNSPEIVKSFNDNRLRLIRQANAGPGAARNRGAKEATSEYVAFLDADDEYLPDFLQTSITNLKNNPDCVLSVVNHYRGPEKTVATSIFPFNFGIITGSWRLSPEAGAAEVWGSLIFLQSWAIVCRRDVLPRFGGFYEHHCTYAEDQYLWLQLLLNCRIFRDTTPLFWYHTEDSDLELWTRESSVPIMPFLAEPEPIRKNCPPDHRPALERMLSFAASLNFSYMVTDKSVVSFWKEYLKGIPEAHDLPLDRPRPNKSSGMSERVLFEPDEKVSSRVRAFCEARSITPDIFFLACLAILIRKYSSQESIVIGTPYANREREEIQALFGNFIRTIPVRFDVDEAADTVPLIAYVKKQYLSAWAHTSIGPDELLDVTALPRMSNVNPICQIMFAFQSYRTRRGDEQDRSSLTLPGHTEPVNDIALHIWEAGRFEGMIEYSTELFEAESMEMFAANYLRVVRALADGFEGRLDRIDLMDAEGRELVERTNRTEFPAYLGRTFLDLFRESAAAFNSAPAVKSDDLVLTYGDLDGLSDGIARWLVASGAENRELIGVYLNRDRWLLPSLLGVFKAGGAYVPLDPRFPRDRLADIISDAGIRFIVTVSQLEAEAASLGPHMHTLCADTGEPPDEVMLPAVQPGQTAYVLYTSGSTGKPKGVPIRHDSLANFLLSMMSEPGISRDDRVIAITTFTFDMSTLEFFLPLTCGAHLLVVDYETSLDGHLLVSLIEREGITYVQATPSRWMLLLETGWRGRPGMTFITGGEALQQALANALLENGASVWNGYGPTETTVFSSICRVRRGDAATSIGKPVANTGLFVLDRNDRPLPAGIPGELGISGAGLSEGYLNRPDLTSGRFVDIDNGGVRLRIYKTGDLVQQRLSGDFRYFGRNDFQVKIRGFRIELGEIESILLGFPGIREAVCTVWARSEQDKRIVAYYRSNSPIDESALKAHIKKSLPDYMVPGHFTALADFPRTASGKTDRKSLPLPAVSGEPAEGKVPATTLQEQIMAIWSEVLGCEVLGIDENFFDLGGHSLLAVELIRKLNARLDGKWKLRDLFESPTVEGLAKLRGSEGQSRMPLIFPVNRKGTGTPFFLVAGIYENRYFEDENVNSYENDFLRYFNNIIVIMGNERPIYGLRPRGIYVGEKFHTSVEAMAGEYIAEIKAIQPTGPYLIGGECFGGFVAHAIACQLKAQGDAVSRLVLLDVYRINLRKEITMRSYDFLRAIKRTMIAAFRALSHPDFSRKALHGTAEKALMLFFPFTKKLREKHYYERGPGKYTRLLFRYRPKKYDGNTLLIINEEWNARYPSLGWDTTLCPDLDIRIVPGDHTTRLKIENDALARCLSSLGDNTIPE